MHLPPHKRFELASSRLRYRIFCRRSLPPTRELGVAGDLYILVDDKQVFYKQSSTATRRGNIITDIGGHGSGEYTSCALGGYGVVYCGGVPGKRTFIGFPKSRRDAGAHECGRKSNASSRIAQRDEYHDRSVCEYAKKMVMGERG